MLLPIIIALFALAGCSRREEEKSAPCPTGWEGQAIVVEQNEIRICHHDGEPLALEVGDRFVRASDKDFKSFQERFRLPNFTGLPLINWAAAHRQIFPKGASKEESERFLALQNYFQEKNLAMENALSTAQKIPWFNEHSSLVTWKEICPQEKLDALALVGLLLGIQAEHGGFYEFKTSDGSSDNKMFVDTILKKIGEGKLKLQKQTLLKGQSLNSLTELIGRERTLGYIREKNILLLGLPLDPNSLHSASNYLHELYHFYQDATKTSSSFLQTEFAAYAKQGEFVALSLQTPFFRKQYEGIETYIQKEYTAKDHDPDQPATWGIRYAQARLENNSEALEKNQDVMQELIHKLYYSRLVLSKKAIEVGKKAAGFINLTLAASSGNRDEALKQIEAEMQNARELKTMGFEELAKNLEGMDRDHKFQEQELDEKFQNVLLASTYLIQLEEYRDRIASGNLEPITHIEMNLDGKSYQELYQTVAKYQPLKYQRIEMNGVD